MKFSCFKRDFMGAPIRRAMINLAKGNIHFKHSLKQGLDSQVIHVRFLTELMRSTGSWLVKQK